MLEVKNLKKSYGEGFSLSSCNFEISNGEIVAFLGANGSGKSTLFGLLTGHSDSSEGEVLWRKERIRPEAFLKKREIGYLPQNMPLPKWVTGEELLQYAARLYELPRTHESVREAMDFWDCASYRGKVLGACSYGMQKRVGLALATLNNPPCLILDEPFSGLDLYHIRTLEQCLESRKQSQQITLLSTHMLPYAIESCHRAFILKEGQVSELERWTSKTNQEKMRHIEEHFFKD